MKVLVVGAGVIGTVYGAQLSDAGHAVDVLAHGARTETVARSGLVVHDLVSGIRLRSPAGVVGDAGGGPYDLVLVVVRADQLQNVADSLRRLSGAPVVLFFGNNPAGRAAVPADHPGIVHLGFPGIGGSMGKTAVEYMRIPQQPTTLQTGGGKPIEEFAEALTRRDFAVSRTSDMDGWLAYHAACVACVSAALYRCAGSAAELGADRATLRLMCHAIEEGFRMLRRAGVRGLPGNLNTLHRPALRPVAVRYWAKTMRSPLGERCFAAHSRHAEPEMRHLAGAVLDRVAVPSECAHLCELLSGDRS